MRPDTDMRGSYITTFSGIKFYPLDPHDLDRITIEDIAHGLAHCCRWVGHTREHYSVAQHSAIMATAFTDDPELQRWALLHDSQEAYIGDMARPLKRFFTPWRRIEKRILMNIAEKFGLKWPPPEILKTWDSQLLFTEARDLMPPGTTCKAAVEDAPLLDITIEPLHAQLAKQMFLGLFNDLFGEQVPIVIPDPPEAPKPAKKKRKPRKKKS